MSFLRLIFIREKSWNYGFNSWADATAHSGGYDDEIINKILVSARKVRDGEIAYERDSVIFNEIKYSWPLLASLLLAAETKNNLRVIDFGGSLGTTFRQNSQFLNELSFSCHDNLHRAIGMGYECVEK